MAARTVGGGAKGAMFSVPGLGTAKLAAGTVAIATAENYLHSAAKGDVSAEALGKALANGTIEGITAGLVDHAAKKVLGTHAHTEAKHVSKTVDDILESAIPGRETKGKSVRYIKKGGYEQALKDFESLNISDVKDIPNGKVGTLSDGQTVNVRKNSSYKKPTLEVYDGKRSIKIRYDVLGE